MVPSRFWTTSVGVLSRQRRLHGVRRVARAVLLLMAFICFVVALIGIPSSSGSGRQSQAWIATGLALLTAALLIGDLRA